MYRIKVYDYFASAHCLKGYQGKCEALHGHNWKVEVSIQGNELDKIGLLMDFKKLKQILRDIIDKLDHCVLNEIEPFRENNPSSELVAKYIFSCVKSAMPQKILVHVVNVWESENSMASYFED